MRKLGSGLVAGIAVLVIATPLYAGSAKTYQVTGPVLEATSDTIVVQKGKDKWEIARDAATKVDGDLKVGAKVTIDYRMTAASVEVSRRGRSIPAEKVTSMLSSENERSMRSPGP